MGNHRKSLQHFARELVFVQIALQQQSCLPGWGQPLRGFVIRVEARTKQVQFLPGADDISDLFHAHHRCHVHKTGADSLPGEVQRGSPGGFCCLSGHAFRLPCQPRHLADKCAKVGLVRGAGSQHTAGINRLGYKISGILAGRSQGSPCQFPQRDIPVLTHRHLANPDDYNFRVACHLSQSRSPRGNGDR